MISSSSLVFDAGVSTVLSEAEIIADGRFPPIMSTDCWDALGRLLSKGLPCETSFVGVSGSTGLKRLSNLLGEDFGGDFLIIVLASVAQSEVTNGSKSRSSCDAARDGDVDEVDRPDEGKQLSL
jgi:hypothetical protein